MFKVKESKIAGLGLFASRDILCGEFILNCLKEKWIRKKWSDLTEKEIKFCWYRPGGYNKSDSKYCLVCKNEYFQYINHSRTPNCRWMVSDGIIYTKDDIKKGEELTIDYRREIRPTRDKWPEWI